MICVVFSRSRSSLNDVYNVLSSVDAIGNGVVKNCNSAQQFFCCIVEHQWVSRGGGRSTKVLSVCQMCLVFGQFYRMLSKMTDCEDRLRNTENYTPCSGTVRHDSLLLIMYHMFSATESTHYSYRSNGMPPIIDIFMLFRITNFPRNIIYVESWASLSISSLV